MRGSAAGGPGKAGEGTEGRSRGGCGRRLLAGLGGLAVLGLAGWYLLVPYPWTLRTRNPERTALMEQRLEEAREAGDSLELRQRWMPLEEISPRMVRAVIVAEDHRFREHGGIDWTALAEEVEWTGDEDFSWTSAADLSALAGAVSYVWEHRSEVRGRSTITQQLAKNLWFGTDRSFLRKAVELVAARRLERRLDKDRILELYLNVVELGPGLFGVEAASQAYFGRSASNLTLEQAAALAGTLPHPLTSNPSRNPGRMRWRRDLILERLRPGGPAEPGPIPLPDAAPPPRVEMPAPEVAPLEPPPGVEPAPATIRPPPDGAPADTLPPPPDTLGAAAGWAPSARR